MTEVVKEIAVRRGGRAFQAGEQAQRGRAQRSVWLIELVRGTLF